MTFTPDWVSHPGETIQDLIDERNLTVQEVSFKTGFPMLKVLYLLNGKIDIDQEIAEKLVEVFGSTTKFWLKLQEKYNARLEQML